LNLNSQQRVIFFLHYNLLHFCIFAIQCLFHGLKFFWKSYGGPFHLFGDNPPITRSLFMLSLGPFSSSILLCSFKPPSYGAINSFVHEFWQAQIVARKSNPRKKKTIRVVNISSDVGMQGDANNTLTREIIVTTCTN